METILYHTVLKEIISHNRFEGGYINVYPRAFLPFNVTELEIVETPMPKLETNQQATFSYEVQKDKYVRVWQIIEGNNWQYPNFKLRITAHELLAKKYPGIHSFFTLKGYPIEPIGNDLVHLYCPTIDPNDIEVIKDNKLLVETLENNEIKTYEL